MWMKKDQITRHPTFARYVRDSMPTCQTVKRIMRGLKQFGALDATEAALALNWDTAPLVVVVDLWDEVAWKSLGNGGFDPAKPDQIHIAQHRVTQFETPGAGGTDHNAAGQSVYIVGATLLHELCHWGMARAGITETRETGRAFERYVYGRQIN